MVYSFGTKESTCMTGFERWSRKLLDSARLEVGGGDGGGDGGRHNGAGVDVQGENVRVSLLISVRLLPDDQEESKWREPRKDEATPIKDSLQILYPLWGDGFQGVGLEV